MDPIKGIKALLPLLSEAGSIVQHQRNFTDPEQRGPYKDFITQSNAASANLISQHMQKQFPNLHIMVEEAEDVPQMNSDDWWLLLDGIEGTQGFVFGEPDYAISAALVHKGHVRAGAVHLPQTKDTYHVIRGELPFKNGFNIEVGRTEHLADASLKIAQLDEAKRTYECYGTAWDKSRYVTTMTSLASALCRIADGSLDSVAALANHPCDYAAGMAILEAAGGKVTGFGGESASPYSRVQHILGSNGKVHGELVSTFSNVDTTRLTKHLPGRGPESIE